MRVEPSGLDRDKPAVSITDRRRTDTKRDSRRSSEATCGGQLNQEQPQDGCGADEGVHKRFLWFLQDWDCPDGTATRTISQASIPRVKVSVRASRISPVQSQTVNRNLDHQKHGSNRSIWKSLRVFRGGEITVCGRAFARTASSDASLPDED